MGVERLVVVGASLAGLRAVEAARKAGHAGQVVLIGEELYLPYDRPPLSKGYLEHSGPEGPSIPTFRDKQLLVDELGVELVLGLPARALDSRDKIVWVGDRAVGYDALVIATGAKARTLDDADALAGIHALRTLDDAAAVRAALEQSARTVVVIGAGFIGSEVASSARRRGLDVTVIEALQTPLVRATGMAMGHALSSLHRRHGVRLLCGVGVRAFEGDGRVERVVLDDGTVVPADLVVVGIGAVPAVDWLEGSEVVLDDGVVCDETLFTGVDGVYAAGDVANWENPMLGRRQRLEHWTSAAEQGAVAARNALDPQNTKAYGTVPYFWSDWYGHRIQFVGWPQADEVVLVDGDVETGDRWVALYRLADHLMGALTLNGRADIMKYRALIMKGARWDEGLELAEKRRRHRDTNRSSA